MQIYLQLRRLFSSSIHQVRNTLLRVNLKRLAEMRAVFLFNLPQKGEWNLAMPVPEGKSQM